MKMNSRGVDQEKLELNRRKFVSCLSSLGLGSTLLPGTLLAVAQDAEKITQEMVEAASRIAGVDLDRKAMEKIAESLNRERSLLRRYEELRDLKLTNNVPPAFVFTPVLPGHSIPTERKPLNQSQPRVSRRNMSDEDLAFLSVTHLAQLIRARELSSTELTTLYLSRLKKYDPMLHCVVNLTEDLALRQAKQADEEMAAGHYRGPLHGIPWGAKDLLAVKGYKTTFGASPYQEQVIDLDSTVFERLTEAGAVLVAKLTLGALAQGDRWFGGQTKSPWDWQNPERGSSGSSAGPGSATAAGLVGFSIGTETRGSIISPSVRCGITGLRPTFGRVSRYGAMTLSWTMDKIGPMCRSAEDCALVLDAIHGPDGRDRSVLDIPFSWDVRADVRKLRVGYLRADFEGEIEEDPKRPEVTERRRDERQKNLAALTVIRGLDVQLKPVELPEMDPGTLGFILSTEAAAAFDDLTRSGKLEMMAQPPERSNWVDSFRLHRLVPAVEYIQANRARYRLMKLFEEVFNEVDLFLGSNLALTNLTGHPEVALPNGFDSKGQPTSLRITGGLFREEEILLLAHCFQQATDYHLRPPRL